MPGIYFGPIGIDYFCLRMRQARLLLLFLFVSSTACFVLNSLKQVRRKEMLEKKRRQKPDIDNHKKPYLTEQSAPGAAELCRRARSCSSLQDLCHSIDQFESNQTSSSSVCKQWKNKCKKGISTRPNCKLFNKKCAGELTEEFG
ncbi:uncharacterized protein LOC111710154 [Eurytemora carolleeae]|uniref:uncharacterized protein LOC111710154 n=1 Tax=Eurytemora carolleeae TaxID=1294199 RepID=UPI000C760E2D|nr:uncharacterized protein LOC111710154 [Eurytemora carolleeae]|eukprot:XP_023339971.1 uncharacterized protein LOC111710154 [Eurytemora affinis]